MKDKVSEPEQKRLYHIDMLKGIAIILVVLGHNSFNNHITQTIYLFHMPLFFVISGFLESLEKIPFGEYVRKKLRRLIYPYITFGTLIIVYNTLFDVLSGKWSLVKLLKRIAAFVYGNLIWENNSEYIGTLWFLTGLFCSGIIAYAIYHISCKNRIKLLLISGILMLTGIGMTMVKNKYQVRLPWCLDVALVGGLFYLAGYYWRQKWQEKINKLYQGLLLLITGFLFGIANLVYMKMNGYDMLRTDMLQMNYGIIPVYFMSALFISVGFISILKHIYHVRVFFLEKMGQVSMLIMIDHIYIQQILVRITGHFNMNTWGISFFITLVVSIVLAIVADKYLRFLIDYEQLKKFSNRNRK